MPPRLTQSVRVFLVVPALAFALRAQAAAETAQPPAAGQQPLYTMLRCIKTLPGKSDEYRQFMLDTTAKTMQLRADDGDLDTWIFARAIIPTGNESDCDYLLFNIHRGFPPERVPIDPYFVRAKVKITRAEWYAKLGAQTKLMWMELWRGLEQAGTVEKGNFLRLDFLKVPPGAMADWTRGEGGAGGRAVQEGRIRRGDLHGWRAHELLLPAGSAHGYNAGTMDVYRDWNAIGRAPRTSTNREEVAVNQRLARGRELVKSELYQVVEVVRPSVLSKAAPAAK
jgi:hypothetical protein